MKERRTNKVIQKKILKALDKGPLTIHEIAILAGINWRTTEHQLTWMKGKEEVRETFRHNRLRLFDKGGVK